MRFSCYALYLDAGFDPSVSITTVYGGGYTGCGCWGTYDTTPANQTWKRIGNLKTVDFECRNKIGTC